MRDEFIPINMSPLMGLKAVIIFNLLACRPSGTINGNDLNILILLKPHRGGMLTAKRYHPPPGPVGATC